jgi:hypothetical protein
VIAWDDKIFELGNSGRIFENFLLNEFSLLLQSSNAEEMHSISLDDGGDVNEIEQLEQQIKVNQSKCF